jgi:DNA-binding protein HU-beta
MFDKWVKRKAWLFFSRHVMEGAHEQIRTYRGDFALEGALSAIKGSLRKGGTVTLVGFGTFYATKRKARVGRNPRTMAAIKIRAATVAKFRAGKELKDALN